MRPFALRALFAGVAALALFLAACQDGSINPGVSAGTARLRVHANVSATTISTMVVEVSGPGIPQPLVFNLEIANGVASGSISVPAGSERTITMRAFDKGMETHRGSRTLAIVEGTNPSVSITLVPLIGDVPVEATFGSTVLVVTPDAATIAVGATQQLAASVIDAGGTQTPVTVQWATTKPQKASVNSSGLVTGIDTGTVRIVGTREGVAASALVTITSAPAATARAHAARAHR